MSIQITYCIGCGCDDLHACDDGLGFGCSWLIVDRTQRLGVCSSCLAHLARFRRRDRSLSPVAEKVLRRRNVLKTVRSRPRIRRRLSRPSRKVAAR